MAITPNLDAKLLSEMAPGELVRFPAGATMVLGIVAGCDFMGIPSGLVIVLLEELPDQPGAVGRFLTVNEFLGSKTGLSYGREYDIVVHPSAPTANSSDKQFATDGALLVAAGARAIRTRNLRDDTTDTVLIIDTDTWKAVPSATPYRRWLVAVLAWELRLATEVSKNHPLPAVFTFRAGD